MAHTFFPLVKNSKKRLGRGHGSGRGKTAGRGQKGQKARGTIPPHFEGGQLNIMKRLPLLRGKGRNKSRAVRPAELTTTKLGIFKDGAKVNLESLKKEGIIAESAASAKVLAGEKLSVGLTVTIPCSQGAADIIRKAGGTVS